MTHTQISNRDYAFWLAIIGLQVPVARRAFLKGSKSLAFFLFSEIFLGSVLAILAKTVDGWTFFHWWIWGTIAHEGVSAFLLGSILLTIRRLGLPSRQSMLLVQAAVASSFILGITTSEFALTELSSKPYWKICLSWDHAFWYSACCLICFIPFYSWYVSATLPRSQVLILVGFGVYAAAQAGIIEIFILQKSTGRWSQLSNIAYCLSLGIWYCASRSKLAEQTSDQTSAHIAAISMVSGSSGN